MLFNQEQAKKYSEFVELLESGKIEEFKEKISGIRDVEYKKEVENFFKGWCMGDGEGQGRSKEDKKKEELRKFMGMSDEDKVADLMYDIPQQIMRFMVIITVVSLIMAFYLGYLGSNTSKTFVND